MAFVLGRVLFGAPPAGAEPEKATASEDEQAPRDTAARADARVAASETKVQPRRPEPVPLALGAQGFLVQDKGMLGVETRVGASWGPKLEASFLWTTETIDELDARFLGNQFGLFIEGAPYRSRYIEARLGLGADLYYLWGIHGDLLEAAFALEGNLSYWPLERLGIVAGARVYPMATDGLQLGTRRDGRSGSPVLLSLGLRWRAQ